MEYQHPELSAPIQSLPLSDAFKAMAEEQDFKTLADILSWPLWVLLLHEGFTYHYYQELKSYLRSKSLLQQSKT